MLAAMCTYVPLWATSCSECQVNFPAVRQWLFSWASSLFRIERQPNTFRESCQQGQSVAVLAWLYLPRSASQDECELCLCSYEGIFNMKQKAAVFITTEWTRWESQWKGWHLRLFIQQQPDEIFSTLQSLSRLPECTIEFNRLDFLKGARIHTDHYDIMVLHVNSQALWPSVFHAKLTFTVLNKARG